MFKITFLRIYSLDIGFFLRSYAGRSKTVCFADRVGDTELDDEVTDCALVEHQFRKGYIRLREYLERKRGCGRKGNL